MHGNMASSLIKGIGAVEHFFYKLILFHRLLSYLPDAFYSLTVVFEKESKPKSSMGSLWKKAQTKKAKIDYFIKNPSPPIVFKQSFSNFQSNLYIVIKIIF